MPNTKPEASLEEPVDYIGAPERPADNDFPSFRETHPAYAYDVDPEFARIYDQILGSLKPEQMSYTAPTAAEIAAQISEYLRPTVDQQIKNRQNATRQQRAQTDADAASRGILASTWVTDLKNRLYQQEAADIAAAESDYRSQLLQGVYNRQAQEADRAYQIEMFNTQMRQQAESDAYNRAADMYNLYLQNKKRGSGSGSGSGGGGGDETGGDGGEDGFDLTGYIQYLKGLAGRKKQTGAAPQGSPGGRVGSGGGGKWLITTK